MRGVASARGAMAVLLYNGIGVLLTVGPEGVEFEEHAKEGEDECEEDEGLVCFLPAAVHVGRSVQVTVVPVVVLRGEDECREPEIREDDINEEDKSAQHVGHERGEESREEEDNRENRNDFLVNDMLPTGPFANEVGCYSHHNHSTSPLESSDQEHDRPSESLTRHVDCLI